MPVIAVDDMVSEKIVVISFYHEAAQSGMIGSKVKAEFGTKTGSKTKSFTSMLSGITKE